MKQAVAALALLVCVQPAFATSNWFFVGKTSAGDSQYVDLNSINIEDPGRDLVEAWSSMDLATPANNARSTSRLVKYDCRNKATRSVGEAGYSELHRAGSLVFDASGPAAQGQFQAVVPDSVAGAELTLVCDYAHRMPRDPAYGASSVLVPASSGLAVMSVDFGTDCCDAHGNVNHPTLRFSPSDRKIFASVRVTAKNIDRTELQAIDLQWSYGPQHQPIRHDKWNLKTGPEGSESDKQVAGDGWVPGSYARTIESGNILHWERGNYHLDLIVNGQLVKSFDFEIHE